MNETPHYHLICALQAIDEFDELLRSIGIVVKRPDLHSKISQLHADACGINKETWIVAQLDRKKASAKVRTKLNELSKSYMYHERNSEVAA